MIEHPDPVRHPSSALASLVSPPPSLREVLDAEDEDEHVPAAPAPARTAPDARPIATPEPVAPRAAQTAPSPASPAPPRLRSVRGSTHPAAAPDAPDAPDAPAAPATAAGSPEAPSAPAGQPPPVGGLGAPEDQLRHLALSVDAVAAAVIARMREAGEANRRHLEALEAEAARRCELLTAQAELDAELIRLHARREAHAIITAARMRNGNGAAASEQGRQLDEVGESFARFTEAFEGRLDDWDDSSGFPGGFSPDDPFDPGAP